MLFWTGLGFKSFSGLGRARTYSFKFGPELLGSFTTLNSPRRDENADFCFRFTPVVLKNFETGKYEVDFRHFHSTAPEAIQNNDKTNTTFGIAPDRDVSAPLIEETEDDLISENDDVFVDTKAATLAESAL